MPPWADLTYQRRKRVVGNLQKALDTRGLQFYKMKEILFRSAFLRLAFAQNDELKEQCNGKENAPQLLLDSCLFLQLFFKKHDFQIGKFFDSVKQD